MPLEGWIQHSRVDQFFYDWQTVIAGVFALVAAFVTILGTSLIANRQIAASREQANRMVAAAREQTSVTAEQTSQTIYLARMRDEGEAQAFRVMLEAAMARVIDEAAWARKTYPGSPEDALAARRSITKGGFEELRGGCLRLGSRLTGEFLDLEREIDDFALQYEDRYSSTTGLMIRVGKTVGLKEQLDLIEAKAAALREKARERPPARRRREPPAPSDAKPV
jgi:hypothetical protein